jgi:hypothetical protein
LERERGEKFKISDRKYKREKVTGERERER